MKPMHMRHLARLFPEQSGFSLIELSVAVVIALFLLGGLFSILQSTHKVSTSQTALAQLQDNERIAMTLLTGTIQTAGYNPSPITNNATLAFPVTPAFATATQIITGTVGANGNALGIGDTIDVRYWPDTTGAVLGCLGTADTAGSAHEYLLFVQYDDATKKTSSLYCQRDTDTPKALVPNVSGMTILYGVDTTGAGSGPNTYAAADMVSSSSWWPNIYTVSIALTFPNPLLNQTGQSSTGQSDVPTITFTRVIDLMARTGSNSATFDLTATP